MSPEQQRYEVAQILAEGRERGFPAMLISIAVATWFRKHEVTPPVSLFEWLGQAEFLQPRTVH